MLDVAGAEEQAGMTEVLSALRAAVAAPGAAAVFDFAAEAAGRDRSDPDQKNGKRELADLLTLVGRMYRDALAIAVGAPELAPFAAESGASTHGDLVKLGAARLGRALAAVFDAQQALIANVNPVLSIERLLFALKRQEGAHA
jgi:hypothetical protein